MDYFIVFHDGSVMAVEKSLGTKLIASKQQDFIIDGQLYHRNSISKILDFKNYFEQYPEKRPDSMADFPYKEVERREMTELELRQMRAGLAMGLKKFINEHESRGEQVPNAREIYDNWEKKHFDKNAVLQTMQRTGKIDGRGNSDYISKW